MSEEPDRVCTCEARFAGVSYCCCGEVPAVRRLADEPRLGQRMSSVREQLVAARDLIADPERWTQGAYARDVNDEPTMALSASACKWCPVGAVMRVTGSPYGWGPGTGALSVAANGLSASVVNDEQGHAAVLAMFDRAIEATT
jgi:hypothetical protein